MRPLVEPGPALSPADTVRFARHTVLPELGELGQRRLRRGRVCVVGAGGLGSPALLYLAAAGVGTLGIVDRDEVELGNLQRQVVHGVRDVGRRKVASARAAVLDLAPDAVVRAHDGDLTSENALDVLAGYDLVLDGTDNFPSRYLVNDACARLGVPLVWGSVLGFDAQVSVFWSDPPEGNGVDLRDLFPDPPEAAAVPSCAEAGVVGALCGQVGALMATEAVKLLAGVGEPLVGRVAVLDALGARWREVPLRRSPGGRQRRASVSHAAVPALSASALAARLASGTPLALVDVREPSEHAAGSLPGARSVPLSELRAGRGVAAVPRDVAVVLVCASGQRSDEAARVLRAAGHPDVTHLAGGIRAWQARA